MPLWSAARSPVTWGLQAGPIMNEAHNFMTSVSMRRLDEELCWHEPYSPQEERRISYQFDIHTSREKRAYHSELSVLLKL
jgi:hypothetical protein